MGRCSSGMEIEAGKGGGKGMPLFREEGWDVGTRRARRLALEGYGTPQGGG